MIQVQLNGMILALASAISVQFSISYRSWIHRGFHSCAPIFILNKVIVPGNILPYCPVMTFANDVVGYLTNKEVFPVLYRNFIITELA